MLHIHEGADVHTADGEHAGAVDRIVLDPLTNDVSHIVVRKGFLFHEDTVIPIELVDSAKEDRFELSEGVDLEDLPPFEARHYVPMPEEVYDPQATPFTAAPLMYYGPYAIPTPVLPTLTRVATERNIPERAVALDAGAPVTAKNGENVGSLAEVVTTEAGVMTHVILESGGLDRARKGVPTGWIDAVEDDEIRLAVPEAMIAAIPDDAWNGER